jgi:hypothetical protein
MDGCPATATCLASTQALRSRCVSSASKSKDCVVTHWSDRCSSLVRPVPACQTHQSDRSDAAAPPPLVLRSWLCGSTKEPSGFLVNHQKPRELDVASANRHSWLGSHVVPARSWFWGSTKKPSMTSSCCLCHHAARTWLRWPPGSSNEAYLSSPHLEASPAMTFRACSSPAPTPVKPNLHLQYLAKNQSTQRCQSLITQGSDHPPVLEPHMVLSETYNIHPQINTSIIAHEYINKYFNNCSWIYK